MHVRAHVFVCVCV